MKAADARILGSGESDQSVMGGSAEDLPSGNGAEKLLVTDLRPAGLRPAGACGRCLDRQQLAGS